MNRSFLVVLVGFMAAGISVGNVRAEGNHANNQDVVLRSLDEYEGRKAEAVRQVSIPEKTVSGGQLSGESPESLVKPAAWTKKHTFDGGIEVYRYAYKEIVQGAFFAGTKGDYTGLFANYTYRPQRAAASLDAYPTMYRFEGRFASGRVDYTGTGTWDGLKDYMCEARGLIGYDYLPLPSLRVTPYAGLGFRYLNNGLDAIPARTIDGIDYPSGYDRESRYFYLPLGGEVEKILSGRWTVGMSFEYDLLLRGEQISHFEDMKDPAGQSLGYDPTTNRQNKGRGLRGAVKFTREFSRNAFYVEPFIRYWDIDDSKPSYMTQGGQKVADPDNPGQFIQGLEPANTTREIGVKMGLTF